MKKIFAYTTILVLLACLIGEAGVQWYKNRKITNEISSCKKNSMLNCPSSCEVCPPCKECSALACNAPSKCRELGFAENWYKDMLSQKRSEDPLNNTTVQNEKTFEKELKNISNDIVTSLKDKKFFVIAKYVNNKYGLMLSPYYITGNWDSRDQKKYPRRLTKEEVEKFFVNTEKHFWGYADGSGLPLELTNLQFYEKNLYDKNYLKEGVISYNQTISDGNNIKLEELVNQLSGNSPITKFVEYYVAAPNETTDVYDWAALALVFVREDNQWYLIAILHNQWTI